MYSNKSNFQSSFSSSSYNKNTKDTATSTLFGSNETTNAFGNFSSTEGPKLSPQNNFGKQDKSYEVTFTQAREKFQVRFFFFFFFLNSLTLLVNYSNG